ncbi:UNVERIFIED_CONTAM: hypothetical protein PYX00_009482 [Menopon gallinae]|uniref:Dynein axonemal heavy chain 2 n=1 Tax=Menopon gallinae TaxID=328185 RepID=A0AAW2HBJ4_9NEOP
METSEVTATATATATFTSSFSGDDDEEEEEDELEEAETEPDETLLLDELAQLVMKVKKFTTLFDMRDSDWKPEVEKTIRDFFMDPEIKMLVIYYDELKLCAAFEFPEVPVYDIMYFAKQSDKEINASNFHNEIMFGNFNNSVEGSILNILGNIYAPIFFNITSWPDSVKGDFCSHMHEFLAKLTDLHHKMLGLSVVYVPQEGLNIPAEAAARDKELVRRLEGIVVHWSRQLRIAVSDSDQTSHAELLSPIDEYNFWVYRWENLSGLSHQLKSKSLKHFMEILTIQQSSYIRPFQALTLEIMDATLEAKSNIEYLQILKKPCEQLGLEDNPLSITQHIPKLLNIFRIIWLNSPYYNTKERITLLCRNLSNQIISQCKNSVDLDIIFNEGHTRAGIEMLERNIDCCLKYKVIYDAVADCHTKMDPDHPWDLDKASIFNHIDSFIQRNKDFIEICHAMITFGRFDETFALERPAIGGTKGPIFCKVIENIEEKFHLYLNDIKSRRHIILDILITTWHEQILRFKSRMKELEQLLENLLTAVMQQAHNIEEMLLALQGFYHYAKREGLKPLLEKYTVEVWTKFMQHIHNLKRELVEEFSARPIFSPAFGGRAMSASMKKDQLEAIIQMIDNAMWLPHCGLANEVRFQYDTLMVAIKDYIKDLYHKWNDTLDDNIILRLNRPLMRRSTYRPGLLESNFDRFCLNLADECQYWILLGFELPHPATQFFNKWKEVRILYEQVLTVVLDYNNIITALSDDERILFRELIKKVDKKLNPGLGRIDWTNEFSEDYITDVSMLTGELQDFVDDYKNSVKQIVLICQKVCSTKIINIPSGIIYEIEDLENHIESYKSNAVVKLIRYYQEIAKYLKIISEGFEAEIQEMGEHWHKFVLKLDLLLEEALRLCVKFSMQVLLTVLHGDGTTGPSPLIKIVTDLTDNKITFTPSLSRVSSMGNTFLSGIVRSLKVIPRLYDSVKLKGYGRKPFHSVIENDEDCKRLQTLINQEVTFNVALIHEYLKTWDPFRDLWEVNKDLFIQRYELLNPTVTSFDSDISRYSEVANNVQMQEAISYIHFIQINSGPLKLAIVNHCSIWQEKLFQLLKKMADKNVRAIFQYCNHHSAAIMHEPRNLKEMQYALAYFDKLTNEVAVKEKQFPKIAEQFGILEKYEIPIEEHVIRKYKALSSRWSQYLQTLSKAEEMLHRNKEMFKAELLEKADTVKTNLLDVVKAFTETMPTTTEISSKDALEFCRNVRQKLADIKAGDNEVRAELRIFGISHPENPEMEKLEKEVATLELVWELTRQWDEAWDRYKGGNFWELETEEMENTAQTLFRKLTRLARELKDKGWDIVENTRLRVDAFRRCLPLIADLKNPCLRPRHWDQVRKLVKTEFDENSPGFTLETIMELKMQDYSQEINEISNAATMELSIEVGLKNIREYWASVNLSMDPYKDLKGIYRLKAVDSIFQALEENMVQLASMKGTRYCESFLAEIDHWERGLSLVLEVLEMALNVQRQWMYLENIFTAEDIRKQLPAETHEFEEITKIWRDITSRMYITENAYQACHQTGLYNKLNALNERLEALQRALEIYMETKRRIFPRFYFISNDDLLEILGNAKKPDMVQPHLKKLFDNIVKLKLGKWQFSSKVEASGMYSAEGEYIDFTASVLCDGPVERWLCEIEKMMRLTLRAEIKITRASLRKMMSKRDKWIKEQPGQLCITSSQIQWTSDCTRTLMHCKMMEAKAPLKKLRTKQNKILQRFSEAIRGNLTKLQRVKVVAIVTIEIHARDVIDKMYKVGCMDVTAFEWSSQLRFYWDKDIDDCIIRQTNTYFVYGYEYLGNSGRLVITPLTDRCYITLTTALHLHRGGSPKGPAGTGKTETVKDLGKGLGAYVIVVNCSEGLDFKSMGRMFSGLAQTGAWGCFDEFNRINIEVLSVVAQQILCILTALAQRLKKCIFEGSEINLVHSCGIFITMNPGYAGRTELPDNLKSMFRPISMIVPDSCLIAEITLFGEGFKECRQLARKVCSLYSLSIQQLSKQDHYEFGLRGMVALLRYSGRKRRQHSTLPEDEVMLLAMKDTNLAKLTSDDLPLFNGITRDLFPGVEAPIVDYSELQQAIEEEMRKVNLQRVPKMIIKTIQLYETKISRHSVMLVGATNTAKTTTWKVLKAAMTSLKHSGKPNYQAVTEHPINPKSLHLGELYGQFNLATGEWLDGVLSAIVRKTCADESPEEKWILFDGPVDSLWIENMNSLMDDNKILTLINSERITMPEQVSLLFEVEDLSMASPATVSRCGMVYNDYKDLTWKPYVESWLNRQSSDLLVTEMSDHFERFVQKVLDFKRLNCKELVKTSELNCVSSLCRLLDCFISKENGFDPNDPDNFTSIAKLWFLFCLIWSICATVTEDGRKKLDTFIRELEGTFPVTDTVYEYFVDVKQKTMLAWETLLSDNWKYNPSLPFYKIIVPTVDTIRYEFLVSSLLRNGYATLLLGPVGTGKTSTAQGVIDNIDRNKYVILTVNMSGQTTSQNLQDTIESKMEKRTKGVYYPVGGKLLLTFLDDLNMPAKEVYGAQPPLELLRQWIDYGFWYDRQKQWRKHIKDMFLIAAMGPPGGGRKEISTRLMSRFNIINLAFPSESQVIRIYNTMLQQHLSEFDAEIKIIAEEMTKMTVNLYDTVINKMLPTPSKMHYLFNLRDISKVFQGLLRSHKDYQNTVPNLLRLWIHECYRVFSDRLIDEKDREWFAAELNNSLGKYFETTFTGICPEKTCPIFADFVNPHWIYEDMTDFAVLRKAVEEQLAEYNNSPGVVRMDLVLFRDAIEHICRIIRVISQPRGHVLLVGLGGSGRQSLSRISIYICEYGIFQIEVSKNYRTQEFREDLKSLYQITGTDDKSTTFLFSDTQVAQESFLEIINNILSSGEVPNLYKPEEFEEIKGKLADVAKKLQITPTTENIYNLLMDRVRGNLHVILCMSPAGDAFRNRIRQYPMLINCTTIDWFLEWPREALLEVARRYVTDLDLTLTITGPPEQPLQPKDGTLKTLAERLRESTANIFSIIHESVSKAAKQMQTQMRRYSYVTPSNFLELVTGYKVMLAEKRKELFYQANKLRNGLGKINEARASVEEMTVDLEKAQAKVLVIQQVCEEAMTVISQKRKEADDQAKIVKVKSEKIAEEEIACKKLAKIAQADLDEAMPALEEALTALDALSKKDISEMKSYTKPPPKVMLVMEAVCVLKGVNPDWTESKKLLGEQDFLRSLRDYDKDHIPEKTMKKIAMFTEDEEFEPEKVGAVSLAAKSLCMWVIAIEKYGKVWRVVGPKKARLEETLESLRKKQAELADLQGKLKELVDFVNKLKKEYDIKTKEMDDLQAKAQFLQIKLQRAAMLVDGLAGEKLRWEQILEYSDVHYTMLPGDCLLATAFLSYVGPFVTQYREGLLQLWKKTVQDEEEMPFDPNFKLLEFLADPAVVRDWNRLGLPSDDFSTENGIIVARCTRWPLVIDPQCQCQKWIKNMEGPNGLKVIDFGQANYMHTLEVAIQTGKPVLLENVLEVLDPALNPVLTKALVVQQGQLVLKMSDRYITYNENFRFIITTKLANPHYAPEVCTKTTLVNFAIKEEGLQAQLLGLVVKKEKPQLEEMKNQIVTTISHGKKTLQNLEDELLRLLYESKGSLLENKELFDTLQSSKVTSQAVKESLEMAEVTEVEIDAARSAYLPCAVRASILFFVLNDMGRIDPMYQFSLDSYLILFATSIEKSQRSQVLEDRITYLNDYHTYSVYKNTCRGLFEMHKLLFSFYMCIKVLDNMGKVNPHEYNFFLKGGVVLDRQGQQDNPCPQWLSDVAWDNITELDKVPGFHGCASSFEQYPRDWQIWFMATEPENIPLVGEWGTVCTEFQKMLFVRCLRPDRISFSASHFIINTIGQRFVEPPVLDIKAVFEDSCHNVPLIFVLSPGVDPTTQLLALADNMGMANRFSTLSLGQGQSPIATRYIEKGIKDGNWVFLANCHLSLSWMPALDKIVEQLRSDEGVHPDFRLWLSSSPHPDFPISILQAGIKMTTEPPKGLKANLKRLYQIMTEQQFNMCEAKEKYKKLLFSLCFFHAILLERKKFQQLGWNVIYSFNDSDFEVSENLLSIYLDEYSETPWDALKYLIVDVNYGGHVTDDWDRRLLNTYINQFFSPDALQQQFYRLSSLPTYYIPRDGSLDSYRDYITTLPNNDRPEAFGQHPNADITSLISETRTLCETLMSLQVQGPGADASGGTSKEDKVMKLAQDVISKVPSPIDYELTEKKIGAHKAPLDVVLLQEIQRYNKLLNKIKESLAELQKGIQGLVLMSPELEDIFICIYEGRVPSVWLKDYHSLKLLGSWTRDLGLRIEHFSVWADTVRPPTLFWLAAFTFPTGFLTAVLQTSARATEVSVDTLSWDFEILTLEENITLEKPYEGVYVRGMFLEGAGWNRKAACLIEPLPMQLVCPMPVIWFKCVEATRKKPKDLYSCPAYYFPIRAGAPGRPAFVVAIDLKTGLEPPDFWIKRGTALLLSLAN